MPLLPVALYGLEVPPENDPIAAAQDCPATIRITMAAIDPHEEVIEPSNSSLVTLRIVREHNDNYEDSDLYMQNLLSGSDSEDESDEDDQNGGPSDLSKSKKARKTTAVQELVKSLAEDDSNEELESDPNRLKADKKGKSKFSSDDRDESDNSDNETELEEFVVCTIDTHKKYQQPLDITIGKNELVYFKVRGNHTVYLTGNYLIPDELVRSGSIESDDSDANSEYDLTPDENELELELDEESDELDDLDNPRITELDDSDDGLVSQPTKDAEKKKGKNKRSADQIEDENSLEGMMAKSMKSASTEEPKLSKKQLKKLKKNNGQAANPNADSSTKDDKAKAKREIEEISKKNNTEKNDKKVQFAKNLEQGPTGSADKEKTEQTTNQNKASLGIKTVDGVKIDDKKLGSGRACKNGDKVLMRYIGKLPNGYVFDSNKKGTPFCFKLGSGEVIRGWDIGVSGMSPGGERRITVPPNKGYGNKSMPGIPANSTLVFDIKMLEVK